MSSSLEGSAINTFNFLYEKYRDEFERARNYDEKKDKAYQKELRRLKREAAKQKETNPTEL